MNFLQLRYFLKVAELGSISAAAAAIWVSQPAVSRQIRLLEEALGTRLFEREARGVRLTEAGSSVHGRAQQLLRELESIRADIGRTVKSPKGRVVLGIPPSLRRLITVPMLTRVAQTYPDVVVSVIEGTTQRMHEAVGAGHSDISVVSSLDANQAFSERPIVSEQLFLVGSSQARLRSRSEVSVRDLASLPLILTSWPNSLRRIVEGAARRTKRPFAPRFEAEQVPLLLDLVQAGLGYTVLPSCAVQEQLQARQLTASPIRACWIDWVLVRSRERVPTAASQAIMTLLEATFVSAAGSGTWRTARLLPPA
ncbi:MAG: LysR family transcriptional regulator [Proteobacteria bacterium]|nr:LysR family transcriptional regulator [Burkholderiales bacterium]